MISGINNDMERIGHSRMRPEGRKVRQGILKLLAGPELGPEGRLPSLQELGKRFGVSYASVSRAIGRLKREGSVVVFEGKGVFAVRNGAPGGAERQHIRIGAELGALLSKSDIRALRRQCPDAAIEVDDQLVDHLSDLGLVSAESILIRTHRGLLASAAALGVHKRDAEKMGIEPAHVAQFVMNGELKGLPIAVNPLLAGVRREYRDEAEALKVGNGRINLDGLAEFAIGHTRDSDREAERVSGFDFVNHTLYTYALCRAGGADLESIKGLYGETTRTALRRIWELIHRHRTCLMLISSATPVTRLDMWGMERVALLFASYSEISPLFHKPRAFAAADREVLEWGGEPSRYLALSAKPGVSPKLFRAAAALMTSPRLQAKVLRRGWGLPVTRASAVWAKAERLLGKQAAVLRRIALRAQSPYRHEGSPEDFWYVEYAMRDYLADLCRLDSKDVAEVARRREKMMQALQAEQAKMNERR
jgi:DNA-binding transcriptional regulator YhcF (GntR family)